MASTANSTAAPSRRQFFGSAAGAGFAAAQPPIFVVAGASSLGIACDWAVRHTSVINDEVRVAWDDDRLTAECAKVGCVIRRAIDEPSAGIADIQAKCRLLLTEFSEDEIKNERNVALAVAIAREIAALGT